ncbi:hypothetical protein G6F61_015161 [Rhizopus arrhizus]|nr:hypothetical protein G6F61_015161 [Rhizopus arrhizus]
MLAQARACVQACAEFGTRCAFVLAAGRGQATRDGGGLLGVVADLHQRRFHLGGQRSVGAIRSVRGLGGHRRDALGLLQALLARR